MLLRRTVLLGLLGLAGLLGFSAPAGAATLYTAPLSFQVPFGQDLVCKVVNVAKSPTTVRVRAISDDGTTTNDSGDVVLAPLESFALGANVLADRHFCRFDVNGGKRRVRAGACTVGANGCRAVLPAQ